MQHRQLVFDVEVLERAAELLEVDEAVVVDVGLGQHPPGDGNQLKIAVFAFFINYHFDDL